MVERNQFEQGTNGEQLGLPSDLFTDPAKYDKDIPLWKKTVDFVKQYEKSNSRARYALLEQLAGFAIKDINAVGELVDNLSLVGNTRPDLDIDEVKDKLVGNLERSASHRTALPLWTPDRIEQVVKADLDSQSDSKQAFRLMQRGMFNAPKTVDEAVNLFYNAAWAMVQTDDFEVKKHLFSVLCFEQEDIISVRSMSSWLAEFGSLTPNDEIFTRRAAYLRTLRSMGILLEGMTNNSATLSDSLHYQVMNERMSKAYRNLPASQKVELERISADFIRKDPKRVEQFLAKSEDSSDSLPFELVNTRSLQDSKVMCVLEKRRQVPPEYNRLAVNANDPLFILGNEKLNPYVMQLYLAKSEADVASLGYQKLLDRRIELPQGIELQIFAEGVITPEQKADLVAEVHSAFSAGKVVNSSRELANDPKEMIAYARQHLGLVGFFDRDKKIIFALQRPLPTERLGTLGGVLEYHRPTISLEQLRVVNEQIRNLRQDLISRFTRGVGKRGYEVAVTDPALRQFGYESILFRQNPNNKSINATIIINGQPYEFRLDSGYRTVLGGEHLRKFKSPQDQAWLELLTLTHLKKVVCTGEDEEELKQELLSGERQYGLYRKQQVHRIEHLRKQSPGRDFSTEAFQRCLKSHLPMKNLLELNRLRALINWGGTKETGVWTYVSGVEKDVGTQTARPVKVAFAKATEDMRQVLPLRQISTEEIARLEKEILGELENL